LVIHNPNAFAANVSYTLDTANGSGTVPANGELSIATTAGGHSLNVVWTYQAVTYNYSYNTDSQTCVAPPTVDLGLSFRCNVELDQIEWTVTNNNAVAVTFTWQEVGSTAGGTVTVGPRSSVLIETTPPGSYSFTINWTSNGEPKQANLTSPVDYCKSVLPLDLSLTQQCVEGQVQFTINNPNAFAANIVYELDSVSTVATVPGGGSLEITTTAGAHSLVVTWNYSSTWQRRYTANTNSDTCGQTTMKDLKLTYACKLSTHTVDWSVTNDNNFSVGFDWKRIDASDSGSDTANSRSSVMFFTSPHGKQTLQVSWTSTDGSRRSITRSTNKGYCTTPPTVTPPPPSDKTPDPRGGLPTLAAPGGSGGGLIPVTGADDHGSQPYAQQALVNLGLMILGTAFTLQGVTRQLGKRAVLPRR
jgi:hypothetical protein